MKIYKEILGRAAAKLRRVPLRFRVELVKEVPKGGGMWYNSFKQSLKHWKNACRRETPPAAERQRNCLQQLAYARMVYCMRVILEKSNII